MKIRRIVSQMSAIPTILIASLFLLSCASGGDQSELESHLVDSVLQGKVVAILDGDTFDILLDDKTTERVRMEGIDCPERGMPYYKAAKKKLSELCFNKTVRVEISGRDRYERILAYTYLEDGLELSGEMIASGYAWHYKKYNDNQELAGLEESARKNKLGLWADTNPMPPWRNRELHRQGVSTKDSFEISEMNK